MSKEKKAGRPLSRDNEKYAMMTLHCVMCGGDIPADRAARKFVTCSPECSEERERWAKARHDATHCRYCMKPSTPEERAAFKRFRAWERKQGIQAEEVSL
jgi:ribosomal protein S26